MGDGRGGGGWLVAMLGAGGDVQVPPGMGGGRGVGVGRGGGGWL